MWCIYTIEVYSAVERNEIVSFAGKWMELDSTLLPKQARIRKTDITDFVLYTVSLSKNINKSRNKQNDEPK
jgi:hypothetical protein